MLLNGKKNEFICRSNFLFSEAATFEIEAERLQKQS